jgi:heat shock protein HslJ
MGSLGPVLVFLAITGALAGVGNLGDGRGLVGRTFLSQSVTVKGEPRPLVAGTQMVLTFDDDGRVSASAGCNRHSGRVVIDQDRIVISHSFMTAAGCNAERTEQDHWLSDVLAADLGFVLDGPSLRLTFDDTIIELLDSEVADPDRPLTGTRWRLAAMINTSTRPTQGAVATIVFDGGRVDVAIEGCNNAMADASITSAEILVGPLVSSERACPRAEATAQAAIAAVLDGRIRYSIDAGTLRLTHPSGKELVLRAS